MTRVTQAVAVLPAPAPPPAQGPPGRRPGGDFSPVLEAENRREGTEAADPSARTAAAEGTSPRADDPGIRKPEGRDARPEADTATGRPGDRGTVDADDPGRGTEVSAAAHEAHAKEASVSESVQAALRGTEAEPAAATSVDVAATEELALQAAPSPSPVPASTIPAADAAEASPPDPQPGTVAPASEGAVLTVAAALVAGAPLDPATPAAAEAPKDATTPVVAVATEPADPQSSAPAVVGQPAADPTAQPAGAGGGATPDADSRRQGQGEASASRASASPGHPHGRGGELRLEDVATAGGPVRANEAAPATPAAATATAPAAPTEQGTATHPAQAPPVSLVPPASTRTAPEPVVAARPDAPVRAGSRLAELADTFRTVVRVAAREGRTEARITLHPGDLGEVQIRLRYEKGGISADVVADSRQAAQTLLQSTSELRRTLEAQGMNVLWLDVRHGGQERPAWLTAQGGGGGTAQSNEPDEETAEREIPVDRLGDPSSIVDVLA